MSWTGADGYRARCRGVFFVLNLLAVIPLFVPHLTTLGLAVFALSMALGAWLTVFLPKGDAPACAGLPVLFFLDVCAWFGAQWPELRARFALPRTAFGASWGYLLLCLLGLVLSCTALRENVRPRWVARTASAASLLLACWEGGAGSLEPGSALWFLLGVLLTASALWQVCRELAEAAAPGTMFRNDWLGAALYLGMLALFGMEAGYLTRSLPVWTAMAEELFLSLFVWWQALIPAAVLLFAAAAVWNHAREGVGLDAYVLFGCLSFLMLFRTVAGNYFAHGWILLALYGGLFVWSARITASGGRVFRLRGEVWLLALHGAFLVLVQLVWRGYYGNLLVTLFAITAFYSLPSGPKPKQESTGFWLLVLAVIFAETAAYLCVRRLCVENLLVLGAAAVASLLTLAVLGLRHGPGADPRLRLAVCLLAGLVCLCAATRPGIRAEATFENDTAFIRVTGGEPVSARYRWGGWGSSERAVFFQGTELSVPVRGEQLVVVLTDERGVRTTETFWAPWKYPAG